MYVLKYLVDDKNDRQMKCRHCIYIFYCLSYYFSFFVSNSLVVLYSYSYNFAFHHHTLLGKRFFHAILHYITLYYTILYYTIPYYTILHYTILYCTILYNTILYCTLHSLILQHLLSSLHLLYLLLSNSGPKRAIKMACTTILTTLTFSKAGQ